MSETVFSVLNEKLEKEIASCEDFITAGKAEDYPAYREVCGKIRALRIAQKITNDLARSYMEDDDYE